MPCEVINCKINIGMLLDLIFLLIEIFWVLVELQKCFHVSTLDGERGLLGAHVVNIECWCCMGLKGAGGFILLSVFN